MDCRKSVTTACKFSAFASAFAPSTSFNGSSYTKRMLEQMREGMGVVDSPPELLEQMDRACTVASWDPASRPERTDGPDGGQLLERPGMWGARESEYGTCR